MKVVIVAQGYGFCPASQAFIMAREFKNNRINIDVAVVKTNNSVELFAQLNPDIKVISEIPPAADLLISCYEPNAILQAWMNNIPCIYYCNLLWFWLQNGEMQLNQIEADIQYFKKLKRQNKYDELQNLFMEKCEQHPVSGMMYGYFLANQSFCRRYPGCDDVIKTLPISISTKILPIGILMPYERIPTSNRNNVVLFQLSGSETPHTNLLQNEIYIRGCYQLALLLSHQHQDLRFIFCANSVILKKLKQPIMNTSNLEIRGSVSQKEQFDLLNQVKALFVSPGLGTTYEALYYSTPFFYLPEQNIGQHPNWKLLKKMGIEISACLANEEFPDDNYNVNEFSVDNLFQRIDLLFKTRMNRMLELANEFLAVQVPNWPEIHQIHLDNFKKVMGEEPFLTGNQIAKTFLSMVPKLQLHVRNHGLISKDIDTRWVANDNLEMMPNFVSKL